MHSLILNIEVHCIKLSHVNFICLNFVSTHCSQYHFQQHFSKNKAYIFSSSNTDKIFDWLWWSFSLMSEHIRKRRVVLILERNRQETIYHWGCITTYWSFHDTMIYLNTLIYSLSHTHSLIFSFYWQFYISANNYLTQKLNFNLKSNFKPGPI